MYILLGVCLSLLGLLAINSLGTLLAAFVRRASMRVTESWSASNRAQFLFFLRIAPGLMAILCVGTLFVPAYLANEPRHTTEIVTVKLALLAAASLYGIGGVLWRAFATCLATRRLAANWLKHAEPVVIENLHVPAFRFRHRFPVIAIVGAFRPRLFIADQIFDSLTDDEIAAALAHENGHLAAADNFKRGLLHACRSPLTIVPFARSLNQAWINAAEAAADDYAARGGTSAALSLAAALVKVARIAPAGCKPVIPAGASLIVEDPGSIASRVLRLTQIASESGSAHKTGTGIPNLAMGACASTFLFAVILAVSSPDLLARIHSALECVVSALQ